jgi:N-acyl-D-amino-acid deacylase
MRSLSLVLAVSMLMASPGYAQQSRSTLVINAMVVDGTGTPARRAAVRVIGDRIQDIGDLSPRAGEAVIDARNRVVAPGFIDCHSHLSLTENPEAQAAVTQGVTTIVVGADGFSESPLSQYFGRIVAAKPAVNLASFSGHNTLREQAMPKDDNRRPANAGEISTMQSALTADMGAGAIGLSSGLAYETGLFSNTEELLPLNTTAARQGGLYASHMRNETDEVAAAVRELIEIGTRTKGPAHVSHMKISTLRLWGQAPAIIAQLDAARAAGIDVSADVYPYTAWNTTMRVLFPRTNFNDPADPAAIFRDVVPANKVVLQTYRPEPALAGRTIAAIAAERGVDPAVLYVSLMQGVLAYQAAHPNEEEVEGIIGDGMDERDVERFMAWPNTSICSDGAEGGHPRGYGAFARVLGVYVRERNIIGLEDAIRKMTQLNATQMGIADRGVLRRGAFADMVIFDPKTVVDRSTMQQPTLTAVGFDLVMVNGDIVYRDGARTDARPGRIVRRGGMQ